jgi:hypothetical protein
MMVQGLKNKGVHFEHVWQDDLTTCHQPNHISTTLAKDQ